MTMDKKDEVISQLLTDIIEQDTTSMLNSVLFTVDENPWVVANLKQYDLRRLIDHCFWCIDKPFYNRLAVNFMLAVPRADLEEHISYLIAHRSYKSVTIGAMMDLLSNTTLAGIIESIVIREELKSP